MLGKRLFANGRNAWARADAFGFFRRVNPLVSTPGQGCAMVIRAKYRAVLIPLALYCVSGVSVAFFGWHAINGERGLKARAEYERRIAGLKTELDQLKAENAGWQRRTALMRTDAVDKDLLEEEARQLLGKVNKRDLVIFTNSASAP